MNSLYLYTHTILLLLLTVYGCCDNNEQPKKEKSGVGDYSGITYIDGNRYAVVSDTENGFYLFNIDINADGSIRKLVRGNFYGKGGARDCEGIVYHPGRRTLFIAMEDDMEIPEYNLDGFETGNRLAIPTIFKDSVFNTGTYESNYGFESIGYSSNTGLFWTTTEVPLTVDGPPAWYDNQIHDLLRLQSFDESLQPKAQYAYKTEIPECTASEASVALYTFGVSEIIALPDGRLLILEREFYVGEGLTSLGLSWVKNKIFLVDPVNASDVTNEPDLRKIDSTRFLEKQKLWETKTSLANKDLANYEGMCLGQPIGKGSYPLFLVNDSQGGYRGLLKDYILPLIITGVPDSRSELEQIGKETISISTNPQQGQIVIETDE